MREDIRRVLAAPLRVVPQGDVELHIGLSPQRDLLEVVIAPGDPVVVLHAMRLRPYNYRWLADLGAAAPATGGVGAACAGRVEPGLASAVPGTAWITKPIGQDLQDTA